MRAKLFIFWIMVTAVLCVSCDKDAQKENLKEYGVALRPYYPYSASEKFVFVNETTGEKWEAGACDPNQLGYYPYSYISDNLVGKEAYMAKDSACEDTYLITHLSTNIIFFSYDAEVRWSARIQSDSNSFYSGERLYVHSKDKLISQLADTVTVFLGVHYKKDINQYSSSPEGAYARIIKHQGLTEFSTDGKTVWRRVKE